MKNSCISHPASTSFLMIREEYLKICDGDHCTAALLSIFERWHNSRLDNARQADIDAEVAAAEGIEPEQSNQLWVYLSYDELKESMLGLFGETKISSGIKNLLSMEFILTRMNPRYKWDKKPQYLFLPENVQESLAQNYGHRSLKNKASMPLKQVDRSVKKTPAIPKSHSENQIQRVGPEPPLPERAKIFKLFEDLCGMSISPLVYEDLKDAEKHFPADWIEAAFKEAAMNNVRNWKYVLAILRRWEKEGRSTPKNENGTEHQTGISAEREALAAAKAVAWQADRAAEQAFREVSHE